MARHLAPSCAREGTVSQPHAEVVGELHLPPEHYLIVHLSSLDPPGRGPQGQFAAPASDELARFMLGDEQFCIVRAAGPGGADATTLTEILTAREAPDRVSRGPRAPQQADRRPTPHQRVDRRHPRAPRILQARCLHTGGHGLPLRTPNRPAAEPRRLSSCVPGGVPLRGTPPGPVAAQPFGYITNQGSNNVSVIDTEDNRVAAIIPVGQTAGVTVAPDDRYSRTWGSSTEVQLMDSGHCGPSQA